MDGLGEWGSRVLAAIFGGIFALVVAFIKGRSATEATIEEQVSARIEAIFKRHEADFERYTADIQGYQQAIAKLEDRLEEAHREIKNFRALLEDKEDK